VKIFICRNKLIKNSCIGKQQQSFFLLRILVSDKSLGSRVSFYSIDFPADTFFQPGTIWLKIDTAVNKEAEIFKNSSYFLSSRTFRKPVEIHLHPGWNTRDEPHIFVNSFLYNGVYLLFPIFNTISCI